MNYTLEDIDKANKAGFKEGKKHSEPSPVTRNLIKNMEEKFDHLKDKVSSLEVKITKDLGDNKIEIIEAINSAIKEHRTYCDEKYAPAWVATALKLVMGSTFLAILGSIMTLILK
jgi:hypothetical protein